MPSAVRPFHARSRLLSYLVVFALGIGVLPAASLVQAVAAPAPAAVPDSAFDAATAAKFAKQGQKRVLVDSATTEQSETAVNPDGSTTATRHLRPVRVKRNNAWVPADSTLVKNSDGTLAPKAAPAEIALSGARQPGLKATGGTPLLQLGLDGKSVGLDWPGVLPAPTYWVRQRPTPVPMTSSARRLASTPRPMVVSSPRPASAT
jgi:lipoprotein-anchoring transpeptidase ErfK/SrfK